MSTGADRPEKITVRTLGRMKRRKQRIVALTAYDYATARIIDKAGVDLILVGDSAANVIYGMPTTLTIGMAEMYCHVRAVAAGVERAFLVADMPFLSYQVAADTAVANAGRFMKAGAEAVKLEGASDSTLVAVRRLVEIGIPVMGHIGLTPQSVHRFGGYRLQARTAVEQERLLADAEALEASGCFSIVVEKVPADAAEAVTKKIGIPTIGIGAGPSCDGQVLVLHDMLGIFEPPGYRFVRRYAEIGSAVSDAVTEYSRDVREGRFPAEQHTFHIGKE